MDDITMTAKRVPWNPRAESEVQPPKGILS